LRRLLQAVERATKRLASGVKRLDAVVGGFEEITSGYTGMTTSSTLSLIRKEGAYVTCSF